MRNKFLLVSSAAIVAIIVAALGIRAVANRSTQTAAAASPVEANATQPAAATIAAAPATFADRRIRVAQDFINKRPDNARGYNMLAAAYQQKERETGDFNFIAKAEAALDGSFKLAPDNYDALKLKTALLLSHHRFAEALEAARRLERMESKDADIYGFMTDANIELGDYKAAVTAAQKMVDLKPNTASYTRVAYLRSLHGQTDGAIQMMLQATQSADPGNPESAAWCYAHLADELITAGKLKEAKIAADNALYLLPGYHVALAARARVSLADKDTDGAIKFYTKALERVPLPDTAIALGDLYTKLGRADDARRQYELVNFIERASRGADSSSSSGSSSGSNTYSRQLALFWADHETRLDDALAIVERERQSRSDIYTYDALAWCLFKKGRTAEAAAAMQQALRLGTRDARLFYHAGMINQALGKKAEATNYLKLALKTNPAFDALQADVARNALKELNA